MILPIPSLVFSLQGKEFEGSIAADLSVISSQGTSVLCDVPLRLTELCPGLYYFITPCGIRVDIVVYETQEQESAYTRAMFAQWLELGYTGIAHNVIRLDI